jgi:hypothetical protein
VRIRESRSRPAPFFMHDWNHHRTIFNPDDCNVPVETDNLPKNGPPIETPYRSGASGHIATRLIMVDETSSNPLIFAGESNSPSW